MSYDHEATDRLYIVASSILPICGPGCAAAAFFLTGGAGFFGKGGPLRLAAGPDPQAWSLNRLTHGEPFQSVLHAAREIVIIYSVPGWVPSGVQMATVSIDHIRLDERGVAWIDDTNVKVIEVVLDQLAHGFSPDEICFQHYGTLSLAQVHSAFAYYYDHEQAFDAEIRRQLEEYEKARAASLDSPVRRRLRAAGKLT